MKIKIYKFLERNKKLGNLKLDPNRSDQKTLNSDQKIASHNMTYKKDLVVPLNQVQIGRGRDSVCKSKNNL